MKELEANILAAFGQQGKEWLAGLDQTVQALQKHWGLSDIKPVPNMSFHYVAKAHDSKNLPVVLKIGCSREPTDAEAKALAHFHGEGSISLLDRNLEHNALLLQQALPGFSLKSLYPGQKELVIEAYVSCMQRLHQRPLSNEFPPLESWLAVLDKPSAGILPELLRRASAAKNALMSTIASPKILHGDLHLDNIVRHQEEWLAIDPKGIIGDPAFEIAAFDYLAKNEIQEATKPLLFSRIENVAQRASLPFERVKEWTFVRLVLSAVWSVEDNSDPKNALKIAKLFN